MDQPRKPRICVSLCEQTVAGLEPAIAAATAVSDLFEVRLDCLKAAELETGATALTKLLRESACDSILTFRPADQGGYRELDSETRQSFWSSAIFSDSFFDVELDVAEHFHSSEASFPIDWSRTICSQHDFAGMPRNLDQIYARLAATPAAVLKIAVLAQDVTDCLPVFRLLDRARVDGREMIAIAMGMPGLVTRILGPSRGAFLTYGSVQRETATAPGQVSAAELREVYRLDNINQQTSIFGLIGNPVSHSLSPYIHNAAFAASGHDGVFIPFEVHDVTAFIKHMIHPRSREFDWKARGLAVTAPHKSSVMEQLDWIDLAAQQIGAVNTIVIEEDGLRGYNTDAVGFITPLKEALRKTSELRCAVIGAGGAARAAIWALKEAGATVTVFARDEAKGQLLADHFGVSCIKLDGADFAGFEVVVNASPLGTAGPLEAETPVAGERLRGARLAYDLVYNPNETKFLREARSAGCETLGGLAMLVAQAAEQFKLWTGDAAPLDVMYEAAQRGLLR